MANASVEGNPLCIKCGNKGGGIFMCHGCGQSFCWKHAGEHRQDLSRQIDIIGQDHNLIQREMSESSTDHPLFHQIDQWEKKSIAQIQKSALSARLDLQKKLQELKDQLQESLTNISRELSQSREKENFFEIHLTQWNERLEKIRQQLKKPLEIQMISNDQTPPIHMIKIQTGVTDDLEQSAFRLNPSRTEIGPLIDQVCNNQRTGL